MLKAHGLIPTVAGEKRRATADPDWDELKKEELDDDAEIKALEVNSFVFSDLIASGIDSCIS